LKKKTVPNLALSPAELAHIVYAIHGAIAELEVLSPGNYYIKDLQDALKLLGAHE
jgi:hypothetical protein